jgi:hypothetical protein
MDTAEHRSGLGQWQTAQRPADPRLRAYVHGYFGSSSNLRTPVQERHVPSTEVPLLLNFGAPHRRLDAVGPGTWTARDGAWVVGLHNKHQLTTAVGERQFMVVRLTPIGAHLFLGLPMYAIANEAVDLALIDPALARLLVSRLGAARSWTDRFAAMESLIAERVTDADLPDGIGFAWRRLVAADGRMALGSLASEVGCSHRALIARFRTCVGFPPKTIRDCCASIARCARSTGYAGREPTSLSASHISRSRHMKIDLSARFAGRIWPLTAATSIRRISSRISGSSPAARRLRSCARCPI